MEDKIDVLLQAIEMLREDSKSSIENLRRESKESLFSIKNEMATRFESLEKHLEKVNEKLDTEHTMNIRQDMRLDTVEKSLSDLTKVTSEKFYEYEQVKGKLTDVSIKNRIIWAIMAFVGVTGGGIIIKAIFEKLTK